MNKARGSVVAAGLALAVGFGSSGVVTGADAPAAEGRSVGQVEFFQGKVSLIGRDGVERPAGIMSNVRCNDRVVCGADGKARIRFPDDTALWAGENSDILIDDYVYAVREPKACGCVLRFFKGVGRLVTGAIAKLNPDRIQVRARMATVGIRGCDVGFSVTGATMQVSVFQLGERESVVVATTKDGRAVVNMATGESLPIEEAVRRVVVLGKAGKYVSIAEGKGYEERELGTEELDALRRPVSAKAPARYELLQSPEWSIFRLEPGRKNESEPRSPSQ